jgi:hypothetical protein
VVTLLKGVSFVGTEMMDMRRKTYIRLWPIWSSSSSLAVPATGDLKLPMQQKYKENSGSGASKFYKQIESRKNSGSKSTGCAVLRLYNSYYSSGNSSYRLYSSSFSISNSRRRFISDPMISSELVEPNCLIANSRYLLLTHNG